MKVKQASVVLIFMFLQVSLTANLGGKMKKFMKAKLPTIRTSKSRLADKFNSCFIKFKLEGLTAFSTKFDEQGLFKERAEELAK